MYSKNWKKKLVMGVMVGSIFVFAGCSASTDKSKTATGFESISWTHFSRDG